MSGTVVAIAIKDATRKFVSVKFVGNGDSWPQKQTAVENWIQENGGRDAYLLATVPFVTLKNWKHQRHFFNDVNNFNY